MLATYKLIYAMIVLTLAIYTVLLGVGTMQVLCSLLIALVYCSFGSASESLKVVAGEPFILNFGYSGPAVGISHDLTKDGTKVTVDNKRTFMQFDKLYFAEIDEDDSGEYHFTVTGNGADFEKTIVVTGECDL